jgi:hypothetical protein
VELGGRDGIVADLVRADLPGGDGSAGAADAEASGQDSDAKGVGRGIFINLPSSRGMGRGGPCAYPTTLVTHMAEDRHREASGASRGRQVVVTDHKR